MHTVLVIRFRERWFLSRLPCLRGEDGNDDDHNNQSAQDGHQTTPPLTRKVWPVTKLDRSLRKKRTAPATSSGTPCRRSAACDATRCVLVSSAKEPENAVSTKPGETTLARMPSGPRSWAMDWVKLMTPAFDAP